MRILFLSSWFPVPADNGSRIRVLNLLRRLSRRHQVTLLSFVEGGAAVPRGEPACCAAVATVPARSFAADGWKDLPRLLQPVPRSLQAIFSAEMAQLVADHLAGGDYDVLVASQLRAAIHVPESPPVPAIFEEVELGVLHQNAAAAPDVLRRLRHGLTWHKHRRYLARLLRRFAACTVVSDRERELLRSIAPDAVVEVVPNGVDLADYAESFGAEPDRLVYAGAPSFAPNREAVEWFLRDVFPGLRRRFPALRLTVTGDAAGNPLPAADGLVQTGRVDDVRPYIGGAWASIVPLRSGGGTRLKVLESMALGTPVVATSKGVEGLEVAHGEHVLIADGAAAFADAVARLLGDAELRARLAAGGRALVRQRYDWQVIAPRLEELLYSRARR